jgi:hypothetical protein
MSLQDSDGVITFVAEDVTEWVLIGLQKARQFRTNGTGGGDQSREVLRCRVRRYLSNISDSSTIFHESVQNGDTLTAVPKGGEDTINISTGTGGDGSFSNWYLTDQSFDEVQEDGSFLFVEVREYLAVSNDEVDGSGNMWEDFAWFDV